MSKSKIAVSALVLFAVAALGAAILPGKAEAGPVTGGVPALSFEPLATLPSCGSYAGLACTVGEKFRCLNGPGEPGVCRCPAGIFVCG